MAKRILVVDDEAPIRNLIMENLVMEGFAVLEARDGENGLEVALSEHPDLILLDIAMPKMDGVTMLKKLREYEEGKDIPVIMLTNIENVKLVTEALAEGSKDYIIKSDWDIKKVVELVKKRLGLTPD